MAYTITACDVDRETEESQDIRRCKTCLKLRDRYQVKEFYCRGCVLRSFAVSQIRRAGGQSGGRLSLINNGSYCSVNLSKPVA